MKLFQKGKIASADSTELEELDVLVGDDGKIVEIGSGLSVDADCEVIDCLGCVLVPGMFDLHVHARDPGFEQKETLESCVAAALHGGVTGMVLMPDTAPPIDSGNLVKSVHDRCANFSPMEILQAGCLTKKQAGLEMAGYSGMAAQGAPMLTDSGRAVPCPDLLRRAMEYARDFDLLITSHCDTPALTGNGVINEGRISYKLGLRGNPAVSQEIAIERDIRLAEYTGVRLHIQQITTGRGLQSVVNAKANGIPVSCEISLHHLLFNEEDIGDYDTSMKLDPPLRTLTDSEALREGLLSGAVDVIASDHSPHTHFEKSSDFVSSPPGASGLETVVPIVYDQFIQTGVFGWDLLIKKYSATPRELIGKKPVRIAQGELANFFVFDESAETTISADFFQSKSASSPFQGKVIKGAVREAVIGA